MRQRKKNDRRRLPTPDKHIINEDIRAAEVLVVGPQGEQLGVLSREAALERAEQEGFDLVLVAPEAEPPVCRILDYGKLKYKEQKKAAEARRRTAVHTVKELRVRYRTDPHDLETKVGKARKFLDGGDRVRFQMRFRGREVVYRDLGEQVFEQIAEQLADLAIVEERNPLMGNRMTMVLAPKNAKS